MCGRYSLVTSVEKLKKQLELDVSVPIEQLANYNIAPTQEALILTNHEPHRLQAFHWGLVPHWAKDIKQTSALINARAESISSKPSFRLPIRQQRCLVIADSFYEWKKVGKESLPYRILLKDESLLVMAGIWDYWQKGKEQYRSFSIVTQAANKEMSQLHSRMPVILNAKNLQQLWLSDTKLSDILSLLNKNEDDLLKYYRVGRLLNKVSSSGADLHKENNEGPLTLF